MTEYVRPEILQKPPIGIEPRKFHEERRLQKLDQAIRRYLEAEMAILPEWIEERNELIAKLERGIHGTTTTSEEGTQ